MMCADLAIKLGVPIYGIIALTNTATDKEGRSVPAPGQGILTTARECRGAKPSQLLDMKYRRRQLEFQRAQTTRWMEQEIELLKVCNHARFICIYTRSCGVSVLSLSLCIEFLKAQKMEQEIELLKVWCHLLKRSSHTLSSHALPSEPIGDYLLDLRKTTFSSLSLTQTVDGLLFLLFSCRAQPERSRSFQNPHAHTHTRMNRKPHPHTTPQKIAGRACRSGD